ncbi:MAG: hypothetical protein ACOYK7_07760 [Pirellulales bacterium]
MRSLASAAVAPLLIGVGLSTGCATQRQDYAYAPPYAPPVYPQPPGPTVPGSYAPPVVTIPGATGQVMPGPVAGAPVAGAHVAAADGQTPPCPPVTDATLIGALPVAGEALPAGATLISDEPVAGSRVVGASYSGEQSPPCPPTIGQ